MRRSAGKSVVLSVAVMVGAASAAWASTRSIPGVVPGARFAADSVTGCLQKGANQDEYAITGKDGKMYTLTSTSVKLAPHIGHTVTVTGTPAKTGAGLQVSKLSMVSASCK